MALQNEMVNQPRRGWLLLAAGVAVLGLAAASILSKMHQPVHQVTLTASEAGTTRELLAHALAASARDIDVEVVETQDALEAVNNGSVDFALVPSGARVPKHEHIREVTPLYFELLHLAVRPELAEAVSASLRALHGHSVDLGPEGTPAAAFSTAVMAFADLTPGGDAETSFTAVHLSHPELQRLVHDDPAALPDAVFHLATMPSKIVRQLVRGAGYRIVPLPFAEAFRLNALLEGKAAKNAEADFDHHHTEDAVIPAFTYQTEPPVPAAATHTFGTRLLLLANDGVPAGAAERLLEAVFTSRFAHMTNLTLTHSLLHLPPRFQRHPGAMAYEQRNRPFIDGERVDQLNNSLGVLSALAGGVFFLWQWRRSQSQEHRAKEFSRYMLRIADIEQRAADLELSATLELESLIDLQRQVLQLKSETLKRFAAGEIGDQTTLTDLLVPVNAARDHIGDLILHVRQSLEAQAESEGTTAQALWTEATENVADAEAPAAERPEV